MAPQGRKKRNPRSKPSFSLKGTLLYGVPFWIGSSLIGWYLKGWVGLKSATAGLVVLGIYIASEILVAEKSRKLSGGEAAALMVGSFLTRLLVLLIVSYLLYRFSNLNLLIFLATIAVGFTTLLFANIKNWLLD